MELKPVLVISASSIVKDFNRTNMELKHRRKGYNWSINKILIAPIWN